MAINLQFYIKHLLVEFCRYFKLNGQHSSCLENGYFVKNTMDVFVKSRYDPLFTQNTIRNVKVYKETMSEMTELCDLMEQWTLKQDDAAPSWLNNQRFMKWFNNAITSNSNKFEKYSRNLIRTEMSNVDNYVGLIFLTAYFEIITEYFLGIEYVFGFLSACF